MITTEGKLHIKRYLAGWVPKIAGSMAFGVGASTPNLAGTMLDFEVGRAPITISSYDFVNDRIVFKAPMPDTVYANIHEVGLFTLDKNSAAGGYGSRLVSTFDSVTENWITSGTLVPASFDTANARIGIDALRVSAGASSTVAAKLEGMAMDLQGYSSADVLSLAAFASANVSSIRVRFLTNQSNFFSVTLDNTPGYSVRKATLGTAVVTGSPKWEEINSIEAVVTATGSGSATVDFDGLRIEDADTINPEYIMVARNTLTTPFLKEPGRSQAIEFYIEVAV